MGDTQTPGENPKVIFEMLVAMHLGAKGLPCRETHTHHHALVRAEEAEGYDGTLMGHGKWTRRQMYTSRMAPRVTSQQDLDRVPGTDRIGPSLRTCE